MKRITVAAIFSLAQFGLFVCSSFAVDGGYLSSTAVENAGLELQWTTQIGTGVRGSVGDLHMNVNENKSTTFFELSFALGRELISERDLDAFGNPRGIEGAQEFAELRKEIIGKELEARGFKSDVTLQKYTLPETSLYTITTDGLVSAINGDTGQVRWTTEIGGRKYPNVGIGSNNEYVAAVDGSKVYCLEAATGKVRFSKECSSSPSASPAISTEYVYVPLTNGRVEVFSIEGKGAGSQQYVGTGRAMARPLLTEKGIAWPTAVGHVNVALHKQISPFSKKKKPADEENEEEEKPKSEAEIANEKLLAEIQARIRLRESIGGITYRLIADDQFVSAATYKSGMLFVSSLNGFVYAIDEAKGSIMWQFSSGAEISTSPIPIGDYLFVVTSDHFLYKLKAKNGELAEGWDVPLSGVSKYIGASKDKLYVMDAAEQLIVLDQERGQPVGYVDTDGLDMIYPNQLTDRLYVGNRKGMIQCLREANSRIPYFHSADFEAEVSTKAGEKPGEEKVIKPGEEDDPFAGFDKPEDKGDDMDANPFGGGADVPADDNPFGGGADKDTPTNDENPFGGGTTDKPADAPKKPADDNPFGGGGM